MEKAQDLFSDATEKHIVELRSLMERTFSLRDEKFNSIQLQFRERDVRSERESKDNKVAVDAALSAQKEAAFAQNQSNAVAISKSEASFTKQIDQISEMSSAARRGLDGKIDDVKERLRAIDATLAAIVAGSSGKSAGMEKMWGWVTSGIVIIIAVVGFFLAHSA